MPVRHRWGWVPDKPDTRDLRFSLDRVGIKRPKVLPAHVDLRVGCPPVYDQGELGSCTAQAIGAAIQFDEIKLRRPTEMPSRLYIYYNERYKEGTVPMDCGAQIRTGMQVINTHGHCEEDMWPYDEARFAEQPPVECYEYAQNHRALIYETVPQEIDRLRECLAGGFPIIFGFMVHQSFQSQYTATTGFVQMPTPLDPPLGGHAVLAIGYDDPEQLFLVRNSWGEDWGAQGNFLMPYDYMMLPDTRDLWTLRLTR